MAEDKNTDIATMRKEWGVVLEKRKIGEAHPDVPLQQP